MLSIPRTLTIPSSVKRTELSAPKLSVIGSDAVNDVVVPMSNDPEHPYSINGVL